MKPHNYVICFLLVALAGTVILFRLSSQNYERKIAVLHDQIQAIAHPKPSEPLMAVPR